MLYPVHMTTPFAEELPHELIRTFRADPNSIYATAWRDFVSMVWAPRLSKLVAILEAHESVMELPPMEWCKETFPGIPWAIVGIGWPVNLIRAYAALCEDVVAQWERGHFDTARPSMLCCCPLSPVLAGTSTGQERPLRDVSKS